MYPIWNEKEDMKWYEILISGWFHCVLCNLYSSFLSSSFAPFLLWRVILVETVTYENSFKPGFCVLSSRKQWCLLLWGFWISLSKSRPLFFQFLEVGWFLESILHEHQLTVVSIDYQGRLPPPPPKKWLKKASDFILSADMFPPFTISTAPEGPGIKEETIQLFSLLGPSHCSFKTQSCRQPRLCR